MSATGEAQAEEGSGAHAALQRIEALLAEGNALRRQALEMQQASLDILREQRLLLDEQRDNLRLARTINEQALSVQQRARSLQRWFIPVVFALLAYASWMLFFKMGI